LYGGAGCGIGSCTTRDNVLSQLWAYRISTNQWAWLSGLAAPSLTLADPPIYPFYPGARYGIAMVRNHS
jgi:hypothetical protein